MLSHFRKVLKRDQPKRGILHIFVDLFKVDTSKTVDYGQ